VNGQEATIAEGMRSASLLLQICLALTNRPEENREIAIGAQAISQGAYSQGTPEQQQGQVHQRLHEEVA